MRILLSSLALLAMGAHAQTEPLAGVYASETLRLELRPAGAGAFNGTLLVEGQSYPVTARAAGGGLTGTVVNGGSTLTFRATQEKGRLRVVSDGREYLLVRETPAAAGGGAHDHPNGFGLRPAAGWSARNSEQGIVLTPPGAGGEETYMAIVEDGYSPAEEAAAVQQLSQAFLQNGGRVMRAGERQAFANGASYSWEVTDPATGKTGGLAIYVVPAGTRANLLVAYGEAARIRPRDGELRQMAATFRSFQPKPIEAGADDTALARQWYGKLRGKMIRQFYAYEGMNSNKRHYLNADGTYSYRSHSVVSIDVPGASASSIGRNNSAGRWRIRDIDGEVFLQVQYSNGETAMMRITQDARNWYLNGDKAFAVDPE